MKHLHIKPTLEPLAAEPTRSGKRYIKRNTDPIGKDIWGKNFIGATEGKAQRDACEKTRKECSPFADRVKDGRTPSPVYKGDKDEPDASKTVDGIEYRGRVMFFPQIPRIAKKGRR